MNKIPTAEEFIEKYLDVDSDFMESIRLQMSKMSGFNFDNIPDLMIEYAKLHVKAALEAAQQVYRENTNDVFLDEETKQLIINAYPENLIV